MTFFFIIECLFAHHGQGVFLKDNNYRLSDTANEGDIVEIALSVINIAVVILVVCVCLYVVKNAKNKTNDPDNNRDSDQSKQLDNNRDLFPQNQLPPPINQSVNPKPIAEFKPINELTPEEGSELVEITDPKLKDHIMDVIPGAAMALANASLLLKGGLYQAIIPSGATLAQSKEIAGAFRGFYHGANGIHGHANLISVGKATLTINVIMAIASVVVSKYYMHRIDKSLNKINKKLDKLIEWNEEELFSKIQSLIKRIQKCTEFEYEIAINDELRRRELDRLGHYEDESIELLQQVNNHILSISAIPSEE